MLPKPSFDRAEIVEKLFSPYRGQRVLVVGIGGGGDVVSTLPTCFDLERAGASPVPAGLTWKRVVHDPYGRPRPLELFENVIRVNEFIGEAGPLTRTCEGGVHIEANVSRVFDGKPVAMIDISAGTAALREALLDYQRVRSVDVVIGVDAGGDVLCYGDEPTLESPICDQTVLAALTRMPDSLLGVFGFGADGEMPLSALRTRFSVLLAEGAYRGLVPIASDDMQKMRATLREAPTEASRLPMEVAEVITPERLARVGVLMNSDVPDLEQAIGTPLEIPMRHGNRIARLSDLSATTIYFDPPKVFQTSRFAALWDDSFTIDQMHDVLTGAGIVTEFSEKERIMLKGRI